jgi:hypothetical protein
LLIEESRTNLTPRSEDLSVSPWSYGNVTISTNTDVAPDGLTTADKIVETTATSQHSASTLATGLTTGQQYTFSIFLKASGRNFAFVGDFAGVGSEFNLSTGSIVSGGTGSPQIQSMGNGWYRCSVTGTQATTVAAPAVRIRQTSGVNSYTGDGTSGVLAWGSQFEAGSFATSYIPTVASSVVRSADVCSITGANFTSFWNTNEGAMFASGDPRAGASAASLAMANSGSNANQIAVDRQTTTIKFGIANSGTYTATIQQNSTNVSFVKISGAYATNNARSALNGVLGTPDTSVIVPTNMNRFNIGAAGVANQEFANGCISEIKYFRKPLSNAKLQALTA